MYGKHCYIEYSWRIFGKSYHNINNIIRKIKADDNFASMTHPCIVNANNNAEYGGLSKANLGFQLMRGSDFEFTNKLVNVSIYGVINTYPSVTKMADASKMCLMLASWVTTKVFYLVRY